MRRLGKSLLLKAAIPVVSLLVLFFVIGGVTRASAEKNESFLGTAGLEFGIICNYLNQTSDMETNFAVMKYQGNGQTNGNSIADNRANAAGRILAGEIVGKAQFRNNPVVVTGEEAKTTVRSLLSSIQSYSSSVSGNADIETDSKVKDMNSYTVDISDVSKKTVYVDANNMARAMNSNKISNGGLKVKMRADQTIVFNITDLNSFEIQRYNVKVVDGSFTREEMARSVIWNMPNVVKLAISSDSMNATVIAPKAFVNLNVTAGGWLVCDTIVNNWGEWHMVSRKVPKVTPTPKPTPTMPPFIPSVTPTPTATPVVTEKPTATPIVTEEPTATPVITEAPTATPIVTEEPTATPVITEEPTATPVITEAPTATPVITEEPTATPVITEAPTATPVVTEAPTATPVVTEAPTATPVVTETPAPEPTPTLPPFIPSVTPTPIPTATPVVTEEPTATPVVTEEPTATPVVTETPAPEPTPTLPPFIPSVTPTPIPTATPVVTEAPTATPIVTEEPTATPVVTEAPTATPIVTEEPTATPVVTEEPTATPTDTEEPAAPAEITETPEGTEAPTATEAPNATEEPVTTLDDDEVPLSKADPENTDSKKKTSTKTILDDEVPLSDASPKTGDSVNLFVPTVGMGLSIILIAGAMVVRRKRNLK